MQSGSECIGPWCGCSPSSTPPRPSIGETVPDAVVQPENEEELLELVRWASVEGVALTPRGRATSRGGGAVPLRRGLVVDFHRLGRLIEYDPRSLTVTVEPGIVWQGLDTELARAGLALRLYPTSYAGSTAGGWLAQGGAGVGSFEAGWFRDNVVSARIALPAGEIVDVCGPDLDLVSDAEGTTGLVSRLTLRVMPIEDIAVAAAATPDPTSLQRLLENVVEAGMPVWSVSFVDPGLASLRNQAPVRTRDGRPIEKRMSAPEEYVVMFAFRRSRAPWVASTLPWIVNDARAWLLDEDLAHREWDERFRTMRVRHRVPSLVPAEVVVPLHALADVLDEIEGTIARPVPKEAVVVRSGDGTDVQVAIHAFIPADDAGGMSRKVAIADALAVVGIAERNGGRAYSTGIYFRDRAERILGRNRAARMEAFKQDVDPYGILNPGKVFGRGTPKVEMPKSSRISLAGSRGVARSSAQWAYVCDQCGFCLDGCVQFQASGWESQSPRGRWWWLREYMEGRESFDLAAVDRFLACTECGTCVERCGASIPVAPSWRNLRMT